jgi:hypothetical protein
VGLSLGEWRALQRIDKSVRRSDPRLATTLAIFSRLAADETMPRHERLRIESSRLRAAATLAMLTMLRALHRTGVATWRLLLRAGRGASAAARLLAAWCLRRRAPDLRAGAHPGAAAVSASPAKIRLTGRGSAEPARRAG